MTCVLDTLPHEAACAAQDSSLSAPQAPPPAAGQGQPPDTIATIAIAGETGLEETEAADFANYFYSYAELDHQKQMLEDDRFAGFVVVCECHALGLQGVLLVFHHVKLRGG